MTNLSCVRSECRLFPSSAPVSSHVQGESCFHVQVTQLSETCRPSEAVVFESVYMMLSIRVRADTVSLLQNHDLEGEHVDVFPDCYSLPVSIT